MKLVRANGVRDGGLCFLLRRRAMDGACHRLRQALAGRGAALHARHAQFDLEPAASSVARHDRATMCGNSALSDCQSEPGPAARTVATGRALLALSGNRKVRT